jgi:hypothetical protein
VTGRIGGADPAVFGDCEINKFAWPYQRRHNSENSEIDQFRNFRNDGRALCVSGVPCRNMTFRFGRHQPGRSNSENSEIVPISQFSEFTWPYHRRHNSENSEIQPISEFSECRSAATIELLSEGPGSRIHCVGGTFTPWFFKLQPCTERMFFGVLLQRPVGRPTSEERVGGELGDSTGRHRATSEIPTAVQAAQPGPPLPGFRLGEQAKR